MSERSLTATHFLKLPIHVVSRQSEITGVYEEPRETFIYVKLKEIIAYRPNVWENEKTGEERPITTITLSNGHEYDITTDIEFFESLFNKKNFL